MTLNYALIKSGLTKLNFNGLLCPCPVLSQGESFTIQPDQMQVRAARSAVTEGRVLKIIYQVDQI